MEAAIANVHEHYYDDELRSFLQDVDEKTDKETFIKRLENHILHSLLVMRYGEEGANEKVESLWVKYGGPKYSFKRTIKGSGGKEMEIIEYGDVQHSTIVDIFGHLMIYDDLKPYARDPESFTFLTAKFDYGDRSTLDLWFSVFANTTDTDDGSKLLFQQKFNRNAISMEPFITLNDIENHLEGIEDEAREREESD